MLLRQALEELTAHLATLRTAPRRGAPIGARAARVTGYTTTAPRPAPKGAPCTLYRDRDEWAGALAWSRTTGDPLNEGTHPW